MRQKAFTLVELLIVIIIIGILATMAVPQYNKIVIKARRAEAVTILGVLATASILYYVEYSPTNTNVVDSVADVDFDWPSGAKWAYDSEANTGDDFVWTAKGSGTPVPDTQKVRVTVDMQGGGAKTFRYSEDSGTTWTNM